MAGHVCYFISETITGPGELDARRRVLEDGSSRFLIDLRPSLGPGDAVKLRLTSKRGGPSKYVDGFVSARVEPEAAARGFCELHLDAAATDVLREFASDRYFSDGDVRRSTGRRPVGVWTECRRGAAGAVRTARILDASPTGLFLASGVDVAPGDTVLLRTPRRRGWLGGTVRWCGNKFGERGVGVRLVFSRATEEHQWHACYVHTAGAPVPRGVAHAGSGA